ncbi:MAG: lysophospholipid acyltransferase family protein [Saprospiraceae bacterium]
MISYLLYRFVIFLFSIIPMQWIYAISNGLRWIFYRILRYRYAVVKGNIQRCFPEKSSEEQEKIIYDFYLNFTDVILESIKGLSMSDKVINQRYNLTNRTVLDRYIDSGQSVILAATHFTNWEWGGVSIGIDFPDKIIALFKSMNNKRVESDVVRRRSKSGLKLISTKETRILKDLIPEGKAIIMAADQNPSNIKDAIWVRFFNVETACLHGIEKYALPFHMPVLYCEMERVSRGQYQYRFIEIWDGIEAVEPTVITQRYMSSLEKTIRKNPHNWLWTHKRWKHFR